MSKLSKQEQDFDDLHFPHSKQRRAGIIAFGGLSVTYECDSDGKGIEIHKLAITDTSGPALVQMVNAILKHEGNNIGALVHSAREPSKEVLV